MGKRALWFPPLLQKSVFVAAPGDMAYLRQAVKQELDELKRRAADDHGISPYLWEIDKAKDGFSLYIPAQADIPLPSDPNCVAVICIFGEKAGTPLSKDFPLEPLAGSFALSDDSTYRLLHPWQGLEGAGEPETERAFPLTGSIFEYLAAVAAASEKQKPLLLMFIGDRSILSKEEKLLNKKWGLWRLRNAARRLYGEDEEGYDEWKTRELRPQLLWLNNFLRHLIEDRGLVIEPVASEEAARARIREFLKANLDINVVETDLDPFKHLEPYGVRDNPVFFGRKATRERAIKEIEHLLNEPGKLPFYGITGSSGAGKSSFLRAGVIARLTHTLSMGRFVGTVIKPSDLLPVGKDAGEHNPLTSIHARCLESVKTINSRVNTRDALEKLKAIKEEYYPAYVVKQLIEALDDEGDGSLRFILGIDQFEECLDELGTTQGEARWKNTLEFLEHAVRSKRIVVIYSVANNRLDKLHNNRTLNLLFNEGSYLALPFPEDEIDEIIQQPFYCKQLELERPLVQQLREHILSLVSDVPSSGNASILPLVSVTLSRMYDHWQMQDENATVVEPGALGSQSVEPADTVTSSGLTEQFSKALPLNSPVIPASKSRVLTLAEYRAFINFADCIDVLGTRSLQEAESKSRNIPHQERILARILRRLVGISSSNVRAFNIRPAIMPDELRAAPIFRALLNNRLIVEESWNRVRLVHEAVLEHWGKAREWAKEERSRIRIRTQFMITASYWQEQGRPPEILLGLGDNDINGAAELLAYWGDDLASENLEKTVDEEDLLLLDFLRATLLTHPRPRAVIPRKESTHLEAAVLAGATDVIRRYLEVDPTCAVLQRPDDGRTALFAAAGNDRVEILELLLKHEAPVNQPDKDGWTPIHLAANEGRLGALDCLLKYGANPLLEGGQEEGQALHLAAHNGHEAVVNRLLADDRVDLNQRMMYRWTPLHLAAQGGHEAVVARLLADDRIKSNPRTTGRQTPLHLAAQGGHDAVVARLMADDRVELDPRTTEQQTPLHLAAQNGHEEVVDRFLADGRVEPGPYKFWQQTPLHLAVQNGHPAVVSRLLADARVRYDAVDNLGRTPIAVTAGSRGEEIAALLVKAGAQMPLWSRPDYDKTGQIRSVHRMSKEELAQKLFSDLETDDDLGWTIPPLLNGAWVEVEHAEAVELLSQAAGSLQVGFGAGLTHVDAVRKLQLLFYGQDTYLVEARACRDREVAGYLTFLVHPKGVTILEGSSLPIHELNKLAPLALNNTPEVYDYLRFFCSAIMGTEGAFTIIESPSRLCWLNNTDEEIKRHVEGMIQEFKLIESVETAEGTGWEFNATVQYSHALFQSRFQVMSSGLVAMMEDQPVAAELDLYTEVFAAGLRTLRPAPKPEAKEEGEERAVKRGTEEKAIAVLRRLADVVGGDLSLTVEQARVLIDISANPGTTSAESGSRLDIDTVRLRKATTYLSRKNVIHAERQSDVEFPHFYLNSHLENIVQEVAGIFSGGYVLLERFLSGLQSLFLRRLPDEYITLRAGLLYTYVFRGNTDVDELIDLIDPQAPDEVVDLVEQYVRAGIIGKVTSDQNT